MALANAFHTVSTTVGSAPLQPAMRMGYVAIIMLPSGMMTLSARNDPSFTGPSGAVRALYAIYAPASVREFMPPSRWGEHSDRSMTMSPSRTLTRTLISYGPCALPSSELSA